MKAFKRILLACFLLCFLSTLSACSIFQRKQESDSLDPPFPPSDVENPGVTNDPEFGESDQKTMDPMKKTENPDSFVESEIARLNSKIEALETKIAVLSESSQNKKDLKDQPEMQAEMLPAPEELSPTVNGSVEKNFQTAMNELKQMNYRESANTFFSIAKNNRSHTLAPHALYWAGEASAKAKNWKVAIKHWSNLENNYPRSVYIPEALAGLSRAYKMTMDLAMAKHYEETLYKAFPDSPAALTLPMQDDSSKEEMLQGSNSRKSKNSDHRILAGGSLESDESMASAKNNHEAEEE